MAENRFPQRRLHRLKDWDYSQTGYYHITICTKNRRPILANVGNAVLGVPPEVVPTTIGCAVLRAWAKLSQLDKNITTDYFCLMPNHIHGIVVIQNQPPTANEAERRGRRSLPEIVRAFKSTTTREYNRMVPENKRNTLWQSSFYDEIIRNNGMLYETRKYIEENPFKWNEDDLYINK